MDYVHFSASPLTEIRSVPQDGRAIERGDKPSGLWFSVEGGDDGWRQWCEGENFATASLAHATRLIFSDSAKILRVSDAAGIDRLCRDYAFIPEWCRGRDFEREAIDWRRIAQEYDAIIIAPYVWSRRLEAPWYYSWDCASGCVWNADAVAELQPL